jgi:hypothetical protein
MNDRTTFVFRQEGKYASAGLEDYTFTKKACIPPDTYTRDWVMQVDVVAETHPDGDLEMIKPFELPEQQQLKEAAQAAADLVAAKPSVLTEWTNFPASGYMWTLQHMATRINTSSMPGEGGYFLGLKITCLRKL